MKKVLGEKQSVAWFKLSEFIGRGEKERALGLFRLLTHSLTHRAFIKKLEAEILIQFEDLQGLQTYVQAAHFYKLDGDLVQAVSIYETLVELEPERTEYLEKVVTLFTELGNEEKRIQYQKILYQAFLAKGWLDKSAIIFELIKNSLDGVEKLAYHQAFVVAALKNRYPQQEAITIHLKKALDGHLRFSPDVELSKFLLTVQQLNSIWHKDAVTYLEQN